MSKMSFDDPRQFTNQMAYQSYFSPPGFSFESPFGYPSNINMNGTGNAQAGPSSMPMSMPMPMSIPMDVDQGSGGRGFGFGMDFTGLNQAGNGEFPGQIGTGSGWMQMPSHQGEKAKYDMFPGPAVNLPTGDRFSQLLERKLGMDMQATSSAYPTIDTNQQLSMAYNAFPNNPNFQTTPAMPLQNQPWDRMAVEANLQDYRQVQIQPDLVAPAIPAAYFPFQQQPSQTMTYENKLQPQVQPQDQSRSATPYPALHVSPPQRYMPYAPFNGYEASLPTSTFPQASPMSTSNQSSPSHHSHQLITPQTSSHPIVPDMSWSTQYMSTPQAMSGVQQFNNTIPPPSARPQTIPPAAPTSGQSIYTGYQSVPSRSHETSASVPPVVPSERTRLAAMSGTMGAMPIAHSQSLPGPGPASKVNMKGMWSREMIASTSSHSINSNNGLIMHTNQPISRSPAHMTSVHADALPSTLPLVPVITKRSRSPSSQTHSHGHRSRHSSDSNGHSPNTQHSASSTSQTKRPKLSIPHPMPMSTDHEQDEDDEEKKVVIACHTCRARKLKCDGARPKCFHCSRRNEDGCSYDVVLRRRGPGRKNKSKGKSAEQSDGVSCEVRTDRMTESGTRFE